MQNAFRIGSRVYLRPLEREDAPHFVAWLNDPEVTRHLQIHLPINRRAEEEFLDKIGRDEHALTVGIAIRATDQLIGALGFHQIDFKDRQASFGISIGDKDEWGKGYGTEATRLLVQYGFDTLNLNRIWLRVYEDNLRGLRAYEKVGFKREGVLRQDSFREGRYWNTIAMGILREEWVAARSET